MTGVRLSRTGPITHINEQDWSGVVRPVYIQMIIKDGFVFKEISVSGRITACGIAYVDEKDPDVIAMLATTAKNELIGMAVEEDSDCMACIAAEAL